MAARKSTLAAPKAPAGEAGGDKAVVVEKPAPIVIPDTRTLPVLSGADIRIVPNKVGPIATIKVDGQPYKLVTGNSGRTLTQLEGVVVNGLRGFVDAGLALLEIRARGMFKEVGYASFKEYTTQRFGISIARVYQLMDIAQVAAILTDAGRNLPAIPARLSDVSQLKDTPGMLVKTVDDLNAKAGGDLSALPASEVKAAADEAAAKTGKKKRDTAPNNTRASTGSRLNRRSQPRGTGTRAPRAPKPESAESKPDDNGRGDMLKRIREMSGFLANGLVDHKDAAMYADVQNLAGRCLTFLAMAWDTNGGKVAANHARYLRVTPENAKYIVEKLREKGGADGNVPPKEEGDATDLPAHSEAPVANPPVITFSLNPKTRDEAEAILNAAKAWHDAGSTGERPVTGTQINRAAKVMNTLDEEAAAERAKADAEAALAREAATTPDPEDEEEDDLDDDGEEEDESEDESDEEEDDLDDAPPARVEAPAKPAPRARSRGALAQGGGQGELAGRAAHLGD